MWDLLHHGMLADMVKSWHHDMLSWHGRLMVLYILADMADSHACSLTSCPYVQLQSLLSLPLSSALPVWTGRLYAGLQVHDSVLHSHAVPCVNKEAAFQWHLVGQQWPQQAACMDFGAKMELKQKYSVWLLGCWAWSSWARSSKVVGVKGLCTWKPELKGSVCRCEGFVHVKTGVEVWCV